MLGSAIAAMAGGIIMKLTLLRATTESELTASHIVTAVPNNRGDGYTFNSLWDLVLSLQVAPSSPLMLKIGSLGHAISNRKALIRYRGSEEEYQPRRGCLEVIERDWYSSRRDLVGPAHQYRFHQISRQSIISNSLVRP
jgi:hypothetical protein